MRGEVINGIIYIGVSFYLAQYPPQHQIKEFTGNGKETTSSPQPLSGSHQALSVTHLELSGHS